MKMEKYGETLDIIGRRFKKNICNMITKKQLRLLMVNHQLNNTGGCIPTKEAFTKILEKIIMVIFWRFYLK
jgi:hypothetical protein